MTKFNFKWGFWIAVAVILGSAFFIFKSCDEPEYTNNFADSVKTAVVKQYQDSMKQKDKQLAQKDSLLTENKLKYERLEAERKVVKTVYIEREGQVTTSDPDSVHNRLTVALEAFDKGTVYPKQDYERKFTRTAVEEKKMLKMTLHNDFLEKDNDLLGDQIVNLQERYSLSEQKNGILERKVEDCLHINDLHTEIINDLERRPVKVEKETNWLVVGGVAIGTAALTYTVISLTQRR